jgi:4-amino-4-deoxy-L-arabinose transferase-like glycosyltransferase
MARSSASGRRWSPLTTGALAAILTLGAFLRLHGVNALGLTSDEAVYAGQAARLAGASAQAQPSPVFRAHPLLFQTLLSLFYRGGVSDLTGRLLSVAFGVALIWAVYLLGRTLYGTAVGLVGATLIAVMPCAVVASRQILLDGPMTTVAAFGLYLTARYCESERRGDLLAAAATLGLAFLMKETAALLFLAVFLFLVVQSRLKLELRDVLLTALTFGAVACVYPLTLLVAGGSGTGLDYLRWQISRDGNHSWSYYPTVVASFGIVVVLVAAAGLLMPDRDWREGMLLTWILLPAAFFEFWPVKGPEYLLPLAPVVAVLAARGLVLGPRTLFHKGHRLVPAFSASFVLVTAASGVAAAGWQTGHVAGRAYQTGLPGGRGAGNWLAHATPLGAQVLSAATSTANVLEFYGHRTTFALSVNPAPGQHNPAYASIGDPDRAIRTGRVRYLVWDAYADAQGMPTYNLKLMQLVERYSGRAVHTETVMTRSRDGGRLEKPVMVIYQVQP